MSLEPTAPADSCASLAAELEQRVRRTQMKAALAVNRKLVLLYWSIGRDIVIRQNTEGWGAEAIERLAADLQRRFPQMAGLSVQSLSHMRAFAEAWPDLRLVQQVLVLLPWGHNTCLLDRLKTREQREWYAHQAIQHGWSRDDLSRQIEGDLLGRQGGAPPSRAAPASELPLRIIEDPLSLDILSPDASERRRPHPS